jgi:hypothetical protein
MEKTPMTNMYVYSHGKIHWAQMTLGEKLMQDMSADQKKISSPLIGQAYLNGWQISGHQNGIRGLSRFVGCQMPGRWKAL